MNKHFGKKLCRRFAAVALAILCLLMSGISAFALSVPTGNGFVTAVDADGNGKIDICDLVAIQNCDGKPAADMPAGDLDGDGTIGAYDYALVRATILGIDKSEWID